MRVGSRALAIHTHGPPSRVLHVKHIPLETQPGSMLLEILAAPINPSDINMIEGTYPVKPNWSGVSSKGGGGVSTTTTGEVWAVAGLEGVAKVLEVGKNFKGDFKVGDWVVPIKQGFNTWQTHALVNEADGCFKLENCAGISPISAGTMSVNPSTALRMLKDFVSLKRGDVVVQNSANSGVGQAVIQLCKAYGFKSVNVIRDRPGVKELADSLYGMGANLVLLENNVRDEESEKKLAALGPAPRLALNGVGGKSASNLARLLGDEGQIVTYGGMSREPLTFPTSLFIFKRLQAKGFWLSKWLLEHTLQDRRDMYTELFDLTRQGFLKEPVHEKWSWNRLSDDDIGKIAHFESSSRSLPVFSTCKRILIP